MEQVTLGNYVSQIRIHKEGYPFIAMFAVGALFLAWLWQPLGWVGVILTLWCAYFFRDPERVTPIREGLIVSPADGVVQTIQKAVPPPELEMGEEPLTRIAVFMNVFNVHVNRCPADGKVIKSHYRPGAFLNASLDKASMDNERQALRLKLNGNKASVKGKEIAFVQIAGLVARRIKCDVVEGQDLQAGERFGLIRFGSRVDVYLPEGTSPAVAVGQLALAGETVLADLTSREKDRLGEIR